ELLHGGAHVVQLVGTSVRTAVDAGDAADHRAVAREHALHRIRDLADGRPGARRLDRELEQVAVARGTLGERVQRGLDPGLIAARAQRLEARDLLAPHLGVVDVAHVDRRLVRRPVLVHADDGLLTAVDRGLAPRRALLDAQLRHARLDRFGHAAERL